MGWFSLAALIVMRVANTLAYHYSAYMVGFSSRAVWFATMPHSGKGA